MGTRYVGKTPILLEESSGLLQNYLDVQSVFVFSTFWRFSARTAERRSLRRPASFVHNFRGLANGFTKQCVAQHGNYLLWMSLEGAKLARLVVQKEPLGGIGEKVVLSETHPKAFRHLSPLSIGSTFLKNPQAKEQLAVVFGRYTLAIFALKLRGGPSLFPVVSCLYRDEDVAITEVLSAEAPKDEAWQDVSLNAWHLGRVAILTRSKKVVILDLCDSSKNHVIDLQSWCLEKDQPPTSPPHPNELSAAKVALGRLKYAELLGKHRLGNDELCCIEWGNSADDLFLGGKSLFCLNLARKVVTLRFPSENNAAIKQFTDESDLEDFGFAALALHPTHRRILAAVSVTTHSLLLFDIIQRTMVPLTSMPLLDDFKVSSFPKEALWLSAALLATTSPNPPSSSYLILSAPTSFVKALKTFIAVVVVPESIFNQRREGALHDNPFTFSVHEFCPWAVFTPTQLTRRFSTPGSLPDSATLETNLTKHCVLHFIESNIEDPVGQLHRESKTKSLRSKPAKEDPRPNTPPLTTKREPPQTPCCKPFLGLLDSFHESKTEESWEPSEQKQAHFLSVPRPPCGCGLLFNKANQIEPQPWVFRFPDRSDESAADFIGPRGRSCAFSLPTELTIDGHRELLRHPFTAGNAEGNPSLGEPSQGAHPCLNRDLSFCTRPVPVESPLVSEAALTRVDVSMKPVGVPVTSGLVELLKSDWALEGEEGEADEAQDRPMCYPMWINVDTAELRRRKQQAVEGDYLRQFQQAARRTEANVQPQTITSEFDDFL